MNWIEVLIILSCSVTTSALLVTLFYGTPLLRRLHKKSSKLEPHYHVKKLSEITYEESPLPPVGNVDLTIPHSQYHLRKAIKHSPNPLRLGLPRLNKSAAINTINPPWDKTIKDPSLAYHFDN